MCKWMSGKNAISQNNFVYNKKFRRGPFQADLGTIVHSYYFRRLSHKTQVHLNPRMDYPRTRLTHSLEVSQIGTQLSRIFSDLIDPNSISEYQGTTQRTFAEDFNDLVGAACLAHDLGQPPFGHAGEAVLNTQVHALSGGSHYEGNKQNIRIIRNEKFSVSCALVDSLVKYKSSSKPEKNGGSYGQDSSFLDRSTSETGTGSMRHPASYLMEAADDIAYISSDIEDACKMGLIKLPELLTFVEDLPILDHAYDIDPSLTWNQIIAASEIDPRKIALYLIRAFVSHVREGLDISIHGAELDNVVDRLDSFGKSQTNGAHFNLLYWSKKTNLIGSKADDLKSFVYYRRILKSPEIKRAEYLAQKVVSDLWSSFLGAFSSQNFEKEELFYILPQSVQSKIRAFHANKSSSQVELAHMLSDFIAGMSDRYAIEMWESINNPKYLSSAA